MPTRTLVGYPAATCMLLLLGCTAAPAQAPVTITVNETERRADVLVDGKPFTSYIWPSTLKKPVLFPLRTAQGTPVTRGFPLEPRAGERVDHPHQAGHWFNYGDVNGLDFWNNSDAIRPEDRHKMGTVLHRRIVRARAGKDRGELEVETEWVTPENKVLLRERTKFIFRGSADSRTVDRITTLTAGSEKVLLKDNKEGMLGLRVTRALEAPSTRPEIFTDAGGRATKLATMDNTGVNGVYLTSEGKQGDAAWGTTARWCALSGKVGEEPVTILVLDHPKNPGYPTYWHARGYGLFAANPLGRAAFSNGKEELNFTLGPKKSVTFRYRILIRNAAVSADAAEAAFKEFTAAYR
jgi:hypothetical protein